MSRIEGFADAALALAIGASLAATLFFQLSK